MMRFGWLMLALLLAGCSREESQETLTGVAGSTPVPGDWVIQRIASDPDTLNPITGQDAIGDMIRSQTIFESLLVMDNFTLKLKPLLAESYEISPDQLTYTFHLRHDVKWQDGEPLTAEDVKYTYDKVQDPKVDAAQVRVYFNTIKSCEVLDAYTVRFTATERYFKTLEELGGLPIIPKHILEKGEPDFNKHPFGRAPVGSGPYRFVKWETGAQIVLERNEHYWGATTAYPKRLVYQMIEEPYVAAQLLKKGEIDLVDGMQPIQWERELAHSRSAERLQKVVYAYPAYNYLGFNLRLPMFADVRVRHAIDLLIPRKAIMSQLYLNQYAEECSGYDPPTSPNYNQAVPPTPENRALALQLLTEAGWKNQDGVLYKDGKPFSFTLLIAGGNPNTQKMAELIQESLRGAGIDLRISSLQFVQMIERLNDWKFEAAIGGWALDINGDPYQLWHSSQADLKKSSNFIGYKDPAADKLIEAGRLEYDDAKRAVIYRQLHQIIHDDYPVCFLFNPKMILLVSKRFQNVKVFTPRPCYDVTSWWVPREWQKYK